MIRTINKHQRWLMIVIALLAIPFVFYFNKTDLAAKGSDRFARVYDRNVSMIEARRDGRLFGLAQALGMSDFCDSLAGGANGRNQNEITAQFILNLIILRHEAARLGIRPTTAEVADFVRDLHVFRGPAGFDINKYTEFSQNLLAPNGLTEAQVEELAGDEISLNRIKQLVPADPRGEADVRIFKPGHGCTFFYSVFNALTGPDKQTALEVKTSIFAGGRAVFEGKPGRVSFAGVARGAHQQITGHLTLDPQIGPGDYVLQVTVRDTLAPPAQPRTATQFTDFQIRE